MTFELKKSVDVLSRTPLILESLLSGLSIEWLKGNEGPDTWSPYDILAHLIHGEKSVWITRAQIILSKSTNKNAKEKTFSSFNRLDHMNGAQRKNVEEMLEEFGKLRVANLVTLADFNINENDLNRIGIHPEFGNVTLKQLLTTWVVHDLGHINQITRVMAKQCNEDVGPWERYLGVLKK